MLHAEINRNSRGDTGESAERRSASRQHVPVREIVLAWNHNLSQRVRFRLIDLSDAGARIASAMPILADLSGVVIGELPGSAAINRPFVVVWSSEAPVDGEYHAGLRFLA
jgi:hypothetical protein